MDIINLERSFKALSTKKRIKLLVYLIKHREQQLDMIVDDFRIPYKTVHRNLSILRTAGFLESRIFRTKVYFKVKRDLSSQELALISLVKGLDDNK